VATVIEPLVADYLIAGHLSVEPGHRATLEYLHLQPLLGLGMRLGEGTGAVLGMTLCVSAARLLDEMATFDEAGVAGSEDVPHLSDATAVAAPHDAPAVAAPHDAPTVA